MSAQESFDVIAVGSGLAGLSAGLAAAELGLRCLILEKAPEIGGASVTSLGGFWIGNNHIAAAAGYNDGPEQVYKYMRALGGDQIDEERLTAFIEESPKSLRFFEDCGVKFSVIKGLIDGYYGVVDGSTSEGRSLEVDLSAAPSAGPKLYMPPNTPLQMTLEELIAWGGVTNEDGWNKTLIAERQQKGLLGRGAGMVASFLKQALARGVVIRSGTGVERLLSEAGRVVGVVTSKGDTVRARAVILTTGGYESDPVMAENFEGWPGYESMMPPSVVGDGMVMASEVGAAWDVIHNHMAVFLGVMPPDADGGRKAPFRVVATGEMTCPHTIVVNRFGKRFADETNFQNVVPKLREYVPELHAYRNLPCSLIFDGQYRDTFSFAGGRSGAALPDWVARADSIRSLATQLGIDAQGLEDTVERFNGFVEAGHDEDFGRGASEWGLGSREAWKKKNAMQRPKNATLGALAAPPYYGIELHPTGFCNGGLRADRDARVISQRGKPIPGLYAAGNAAAHTEYGVGYQAGYSLTSAMTFGYVAVRHLHGTLSS